MAKHGMKIVSVQTGLSPHVLRVWEKRYNAVTPFRTDTNRRIYTDDELRRLKNLSILTAAGYSIGQIAQLPCPELQIIVGKCLQNQAENDSSSPINPETSVDQQLINSCVSAAKKMDQQALEEVLDKANLALGYSGLLERVIVPLMTEVGRLWQVGEITSADEHAASGAVRDYLARSTRPFSLSANAPNIIVATPAGQLHEIGAVIAASLARKLGWNVTYLGASLPAVEIASAALKKKAKAVALSIVYPSDDPHLIDELEQLAKHLPDDIPILAGGRSSKHYQHCFEKLGINALESISDLHHALTEIREPSPTI